MLPILLSLLVAPTMAMGGVQLHSRAAQSIAVCTQQFAWMDNSKNISPCQVAASLDALCNNGNWIIPALNASVKYNLPSATDGTASFCTCSWASYNLISACIACQGFPEQISQWSVYSVGCSGMLSNGAFPSNLTLPSDVAIPYWAGKDPTQWPALTFNVPSAQQIVDEGHPDITSGNTSTSTSTPKKSKNIGAIVGGVIGGVMVILIAVAVALSMLSRHRKLTQSGTPIMEKPAHMRSISETTTGSNFKSGYTTLTSSTPTPMMASNPPSSPTMLTHTSSIRSIPGFMSSIAGSVLPYGRASPPPRHQMSPPLPSNPEEIISPFTLPPTHNPDTKQSNGAYPVFDPPNAPPSNIMRIESYRSVTPTQRARYNPPAYEESSGSSSGPPRHREKQPSTDTLLSATSSRGNLSANDSGMANIAGLVSPSPPKPAHQGHHPQLSTLRDERHQPPPTPTDPSISGTDIA